MSKAKVERLRQAYLAELFKNNANSKEKMALYFSPGRYGYHEALDRLGIAIDFIENTCMEHPAIALDAELYQMVYRATAALDRALGRAHYRHDEFCKAEADEVFKDDTDKSDFNPFEKK